MKANTSNNTRATTLKVSKIIGIALCFFCSFLVNQLSYASALTTHKEQVKFAEGAISTSFHGKISPEEFGHKYTFHGEKGQYTMINLSAHPDDKDNSLKLANVGVMTSPSGKMDGTKGGIVYQNCLTETGNYHLRISTNSMSSNGGIAGYQAELVILPKYVSKALCNKNFGSVS